MEKVKITSYYPERIIQKLKKGICLVTLTAILAASLTGCGGDITEGNNYDYSYSQSQTSVSISYGDFCDEDVQSLPSSLEDLYLYFCTYISDLSLLPKICPNIRELSIDNCPSICDLSFIYELHNLESLTLNNCAYITPELIQYLDSMGIEHNLGDYLVSAEKVDEIISEIITEDMNDEEKIQVISLYVIKNYKYKISKVSESNEEPLKSMFENEGGVCASYAYLTNVLLRKAGVTSYEIVNNSHAWNLIELDGKYYYLDPTNLNQIPIVSKLLIDKFGIGLFYMTDPKATSFSAMSDYDNTDKVLIPDSLIEDIKAGEDEKTLYEKYGNSVPARVIELLIICVALGLGIKGIGAIKESARRRKNRKRNRRR